MKTIRKLTLSVFCILVSSICACNKQDIGGSETVYEITERKDISLTTKQVECIQFGNKLAFDYIRTIVKKPWLIDQQAGQDFFISPLGLDYLLGLLNCGATGDGAEEILSVFGLSKEDGAELNEYIQSLTSQLKDIDPLVTICSANIGYINTNKFELEESYSNAVKQYYDADVTAEDFNDCDSLTLCLNSFCEEKTQGMIPFIYQINPWDNFVLLNALYYKGIWKSRFEKENSCNELFTKRDGTSISVWMMKQKGTFLYKKEDGFKVACLPYGNEAYQMYVLLPDNGFNTDAIIDRLNASEWSNMISTMKPSPLEMWLPAFESISDYSITNVLPELGLGSILKSGNLDLMAKAIEANKVIQKSVIRVSEEGTEAAAITGVVWDTIDLHSSTPSDPSTIKFHASNPFLYLITEQSTGAILYAGRYEGSDEE